MLSGDSWNLVAIWRTKQVWNIGGRSLPSYMHHYDILMLILLISDLDSGQPFIKSLSLQIFGNSWEYLVDFCQCISFWKKNTRHPLLHPFLKAVNVCSLHKIKSISKPEYTYLGPWSFEQCLEWNLFSLLLCLYDKWQHGSVFRKNQVQKYLKYLDMFLILSIHLQIVSAQLS